MTTYERADGPLDRIGRVGELLLASIDPNDIVVGVARGLCELGGMQRCVVLGLDTAGEVRGRVGVGVPANLVDGLRYDVASSPLTAQVLAATAPVHLERRDAGSDPLASGLVAIGMQGSIVATGLRAPREPALGLAVMDRGNAAAWLSEAESRAVTSFAYLSALAMQNVELVESSRRLATVLERSRVAAEVHDGVSQALFATRMKLQEAYSAEGLPARVRRSLGEALRHAHAAGEGLHAALYALGTEDPDIETPAADNPRRTIGHLLLDEVAAFTQRTGVTGDVNVHGSGPEPPGASRKLVLRTLREGLTNIEKYAEATEIAIDIRSGGSWWMIEIADDGVGEPRTVQRHLIKTPRAFGLASLAEEAARVGGRLWIRRSTRLSGIGLILTVPTAAGP